MHYLKSTMPNGDEVTHQCDTCKLKFGLIVVVDTEIAQGKPYYNNCPRCMSNQISKRKDI